jgi:CRP-like cAMP-binding protein
MKHELPFWSEQLKRKYPIITDEEWQLLDRMAHVKYIRKGDSFLNYGKVARFSAFVLSGLFKFSILDEDGNEKIIKFGFPNDFLANCESYNKKAPSAVSITALEDAVILSINIKKLQPLYDLHINLLHVTWNCFGKYRSNNPNTNGSCH